MSEETLLSQLCSICHIHPPKYTCPRCQTRTCSLPCSRKHKTWSQCSGVRDPAAYRTRAQLLSSASEFDRDFNFITGIERSLERAQRVVADRGIDEGLEHGYMLSAAAAAATRRKRKRNGDEKNSGGGGGGLRLRKGEAAFERAAEEAGVRLVRAPRGLTRRNGNASRFHAKHKCLQWSVEWILAHTGQILVRPCLENTSVREAYDRVFPVRGDAAAAAAVDGTKGTQNEEPEQAQIQIQAQAQAQQTESTGEQNLSHRNVYLYLHCPRTTATATATKNQIVLAPISPTATLREALRGRSVIEFPTVYVLRTALPEKEVLEEGGKQFVLEEKDLQGLTDLMDHGAGVEGVDEEEEEDYTSSEGSESDETSDEEDEDDESDENDDEEDENEGKNQDKAEPHLS